MGQVNPTTCGETCLEETNLHQIPISEELSDFDVRFKQNSQHLSHLENRDPEEKC